MSLSGQWLGKYSGSNSGTLVIEIDDVGDHYEGAACAWEDNPNQPSSLVKFATKTKESTHRLEKLPVVAMNAAGEFLTPETLQRLQEQGFNFPKTADVEFALDGTNLSVKGEFKQTTQKSRRVNKG